MMAGSNVSVGVVQGRLLPQLGSFIQDFPTGRWLEEMQLASTVGCRHVEWIVTDDDSSMSALRATTPDDMTYIRTHLGVDVDTVCYDAIVTGEVPTLDAHFDRLKDLIDVAFGRGFRRVVLPLLERASIRLPSRRRHAARMLGRLALYIDEVWRREARDTLQLSDPRRCVEVLPDDLHAPSGLFSISLETDMSASELATMKVLAHTSVTLDTGNLLRLGYDIEEHLDAYGDAVDNVHVKDCTRGGRSVLLGSGDLTKGLLRRVVEATRATRVTLQAARPPTGITDLQQFVTHKAWIEEAVCGP